MTTVKWVDTPRWVTGIPAYAAAPIALGDAGHDLERDARRRQRLGFLAAAPEHERIAALQPHDGRAGRAPLHEQRVDLVLGELDRARRLRRRDQLGAAWREVQERGRDEPVVDDDVGAREHARRRAP